MPDSIDNDLNSQVNILLSNRKQMQKFHDHAQRVLESNTQGLFARPYTADDIINIVAAKLCGGKFHWNKDKCSLTVFFWFRINTVAINIIKNECKFLPVEIKECTADYDDSDNDEPVYTYPEQLVTKEFIMEPDIDDTQEIPDYIDPLEFTETAFKLFKDSPEEFCVLDEMYKGFKPRQIAEHLGLKVTEVYNIRQRIRRALQNYYFQSF